MEKGNNLFTSEAVCVGHPDKIADQISDTILDAMLAQDPNSRVAVETLVSTGLVVTAGEVTTNSWVDIPDLVRETIKEIGYDDSSIGFDYHSCAVLSCIGRQSPDIAQGVDTTPNKEQGAGDQGMMFGYAVNETDSLMPLPIELSHQINKRLAEMRRSKKLPYLRPDGKGQVTVEYKGRTPVRIHTVVLSAQHAPDVPQETIRRDLIDQVIKPCLPTQLVDDAVIYHVNPTGRFVVGGPQGDCGLTGRKIIVDTYGGRGRHGGGAFSGKDPSKVDRSAAYAARHVAKNIVASGAAQECEVQVAYAIGVAKPVSIHVNTFGTGTVSDERLAEIIAHEVDLRPAAIIERLALKRPIYKATARNGHFGNPEFPWEQLNLAAVFKSKL